LDNVKQIVGHALACPAGRQPGQLSRDREGAVPFLPTRDRFLMSRDRKGAVPVLPTRDRLLMSRDREGAVLFLPTREPFLPSRGQRERSHPKGAHP